MLYVSAIMLAAQAAPLATVTDYQDHVVAAKDAWRAYPGGWTPQQVDLLHAKTVLLDWLVSPARSSTDYDPSAGQKNDWYLSNVDIVAKNIKDYRIQYLGVRYSRGARTYQYNATGRRGILIHGFIKCSALSEEIDLSKECVVMDGGLDFFDALVDEEDRKMVWFAVHGLA